MTIYYKEGYKYQLTATFSVRLDFCPPQTIKTDYITFAKSGRLTLKKGYASDGPSGPTIDTKNFMRGAFVHDALYQLMREGLLSADYRKQADNALRKIVLEDGMSAIRAWWVYQGVRLGGGPAADPENDNPILEAP